jgi:hypothetical protein
VILGDHRLDLALVSRRRRRIGPRSIARTADAPDVNPSGRSRLAAASSPPERSSVHHYAGENRPTLRMPSAQLRALVTSTIPPPVEDTALPDPSIAISHSVPIGVVNGVPIGSVDIAFTLDSSSSTRTAPDQDVDHAPDRARDPAFDRALEDALVALDAIDDVPDDDGLDDFEAQPTAYRVRAPTLDDLITPCRRAESRARAACAPSDSVIHERPSDKDRQNGIAGLPFVHMNNESFP